MKTFEPDKRKIQVRGQGERSPFLFLFDPNRQEIEIKHRGVTYCLKVHDLIEFSKGERLVFHAPAGLETSDDEPMRGLFE